MNPEILELINAAKEKGSINPDQRKAILSKAKELNEDVKAVELILEFIPVKQPVQGAYQNQSNNPATSNTATSKKYGDVKKCPHCGATVQSTQIRCPECNYEFEDVAANSSIQKLFDMLLEVDRNSILGINAASKKISIIQNFPIPNAKADIIEFIIALQAKTENTNDKYTDAYRVKYEECVNKAKVLFPNDPMLQPLLEDYERIKKDAIEQKARKKRFLRIVIVIFILIVLAILFFTSNFAQQLF